MTLDNSECYQSRNTAAASKDEEVSCWNCLSNDDHKKESLPLSKVRKQHREKLRLYAFLASQVTKPKAVSLKQRVSENYSVAKQVDERILEQQSNENYYADNIEQHLTSISGKLKASPELGPKMSKVSQSKLLHIENELYSLADELKQSASKLNRVSEKAEDVVIKKNYTENVNHVYKTVSLETGLSTKYKKTPEHVEVQSKVLVDMPSPRAKRSIQKNIDIHKYSSVIEFKKRDNIIEELNDEIHSTVSSSGRTSSASDKIEIASYCGSDSGFADSSTNHDISSPELSVKNERLKSCLREDKASLPTLSGGVPATSTTSLYTPTTTSTRVSDKCNRWSTLSIHQRPISFRDETYISESVSPGHATLPRRSNSPLPHERDLDRFSLNRSGLQGRSESMASVYSGAGEGMRGNVTVRGDVQFSLLYNYRLGALEVGVRRCRDLAPVDVKRNRSDPYVKVYLLPDKSKTGKRKTKVKKNTLNPIFEETLSFVQPLASLSSRTLWLSVWHADMFGRNDFLGEVALPLADVVFDDPAPMWYKLHERTEQFDEQQGTRGDLIIGLKFETSESGARAKGTLHVLVKEAKNVVATKPNGLADVFCKSYLLPERGRLAKQKTNVCRRTLNPRWEHTFTYRGLGMQELSTRALELSLWDRDRLASNDFMGAVRLSLGTGTYMGANVNWMDSVGKEVSLWQDMMQNPNIWVERSLPLRPQLNN